MIHPDLFPFFRKLAKNNRKAWFNPRKAEYKKMHAVFAEGLDEIAVEIAEFDPRVERYLDEPNAVKVFRIYKDSRFQKSPVPLKTNVSGLVASGPEGPYYYVQVGPGESFAGGGMWQPSPPLLAAVREEVAESYRDLEAVLADPEFRSVFPQGLSSEDEVKTAPRGYSVDDPAIHFLRKKSFTVGRAFSDDEVLAEDFHDRLLYTFEMMHRLHRYLHRAFPRVEK